MLRAIDHLVIAVTDPDDAANQLEARLGLAPGGGGRHDALGTFNRLVWLGDTYLELMGVFDRDLAAGSWVGAPALPALDRGGGLATWAVATDAIADDVAALRARGSDIAEPIAGERRRPDGAVVRWRLAAPTRLGPDRPPFLIEHDPATAEWTPEDRTARAVGPARLTVLELAVDDPNTTMQAFLRAVGLRFRPSLSGGGARDADVGGQLVRLRPRRATEASAPAATVHLTIRDREPSDIDVLGLRWRIRPAPIGGA
jgi:hypothetical protein